MWWTDPFWLLALITVWPLCKLGNILRRHENPQSLKYQFSEHPDRFSPDSQAGLKRLTWLRVTAVIATVLALAGTSILLPTNSRRMVVLIDVSESIGPAQIEQARNAGISIIRQLKEKDQVAVVAFAGEPRVITPLVTPEQAVSLLETVNLQAPNSDQSNIKAAILVSKELLSEVHGNRSMILFSDGQSTIGGGTTPDLMSADFSGTFGIPVQTIPVGLPSGGLYTQELNLPEVVHPGERVLAEWKAVSDRSQVVKATIRVDGQVTSRLQVQIEAGKNNIPLALFSAETDPHRFASGIHRVEVEFSDAAGDMFTQATRGGLLQVSGPAKILLTSGENPFAPLRQALGIQGMIVHQTNTAGLPETISGLTGYSAVILDNVPALYLTDSQQTVLQEYVAGGGGLLVIGGDASLGRGEYYATGLEDLLPVRTDTRQRLFFSRAEILFVLDHSGSMSENVGNTSKQLAAMQGIVAAVQDLNPLDEVAILTFDTKASWVLPFTPVSRRAEIKRALSQVGGGGGTDMSSAFQEAIREFSTLEPVRRHVVILTDGLTDTADFRKICRRLSNLGVTITSIGVGDQINETLLRDIAQWGNGQFYRASQDQIPKIIKKETIRITRDLIQEGTFVPVVKNPAPFLNGLERGMPPLYGYLITKPKNLATVYLQIGKDQDPLLAGWHYGNGQVAVFTSDSGRRWLGPWSGATVYNKFWSQIIRSIERGSMDQGLRVSTQVEAATALIVVEAIGADRHLRPGLQLVGRGENGNWFNLRETAPGHYEARVSLTGIGLQQFEVRESQGGNWAMGWVWNPPSEELQTLGPDLAKLGKISSSTGGKMLSLAESFRNPMLVLPPNRWAWELIPIRDWLVITVLFLLLIELGYRSASLGQMAMARALFASWWATRVKIIEMMRNINHPELKTANSQSTKQLTSEAYRYLAESSRRRRKEGQNDT